MRGVIFDLDTLLNCVGKKFHIAEIQHVYHMTLDEIEEIPLTLC